MSKIEKVSPEEGPLGLYIHVPFCAKACEYCAFYQEKPEKDGIKAYLEGIEAELEKFPPARPVSTIFMGGGTPSLLATDDLKRLCSAIKTTVSKRESGESPRVEWTIEMAPSTVKAEKLEMLKEMGVNRFSLGVQSFNPATLEAIGRPHSLKQVEAAIALIKEAKIENWNIDLIFAASEATLADWLRDLERAVNEAPKHISTYCLTFESDTKMFLKMLRGLKRKPTPEEEAKFYEATWEFLEGREYKQYEVSNFAREGYGCSHNINTWRMGEWVGYGPSAASQICLGDGHWKRFSNISDLGKWEAGVASGNFARVEEESLTAEGMLVDALIFGLRMREGVDVKKLEDRFGPMKEVKRARWNELLDSLVAEDVANKKGECMTLTPKGMLLADAVAGRILEVF